MRYRVSDFIRRTKTKRFGLGLTGLALAAATVAFTYGGSVQAVVGGPTCHVPADYATIQAAVDVATCSTIKVAAGTYDESVAIGRALTLKGAESGDSADWRTFAGPNESTVNGATAGAATFTVNAADVTIDGFSITNPGEGIGVTVKTAGNNAVIKNNIVDGVGGASFANHTVGVYLELGPDNVKIADNKISHIQSANPAGSPGTAQGILVGDSTSADPSLGVRIEDNTIKDITSSTRGAYGVQVNNGASTAPTATGYATVKILSNTIKDLSGNWVHAIGLEGDTPNAVVKHNTIGNLTSPTANKVAVWFEDNIFFFTGEVTQNNLAVSNTAVGIGVEPALTTLYPTLSADGTCNWWGSKNGPGTVGPGSGSLVSAGVDYKPWQKSSHLKGDCGERDHRDYNDGRHGHGNDDKKRWGDWDD